MIDPKNKLFKYGMWWRIFYGILRTISGLILLRMVGRPFADIVEGFTGDELRSYRFDPLFNLLNTFFNHFPYTVTHFVAAYLIFWGLMDIILSIALLRHKIWSFHISIYLIGFFTLYEVYRFFQNHSKTLLLVIFVDTVILWIIHKEYLKVKKYLARQQSVQVATTK